ncbi:ADAM 17-like protease [Physella acuta]|uniref:ADAM 17-like protease n=1 Tax=Physella acuta TaxID=109671 RepID=UPI0027DDEDE7|nr:ADAM 17-like protease [Physella acuta]
MRFLSFSLICIVFPALSIPPLKYYETLTHISVSTHVKRSDGNQILLKHLKFKMFSRLFHVSLKSGTDVLAKGFKAHLVHGDGRMTSYYIDQSKIFTGHLSDNTESSVNAHIEDTLWFIIIFDGNETYTVEPARNLLKPYENLHNDTLIAYRGSDLKSEGSHCGVKYPEDFAGLHVRQSRGTFAHHSKGSANRPRREENRDTCSMYYVADYHFFSRRCRKQYLTCSSLMITFVENVNAIYRRSRFVDRNFHVIEGAGLQIGMLILYVTPTYSADTIQPHFNAKDIRWEMRNKHKSFSYFTSYVEDFYCHHHLLTSYPMPGRILGMAYIGGVCHLPVRGYLVMNTGVSSGIDSLDGDIPSLQFNLVMAHEVGHIFGSNHDPDTGECLPPTEDGGRYLMWDRAVTGQNPNHKVLSPCSLREIGDRLSYAYCLVEKSSISYFCGNGIVDPGEECDAGALGIANADDCCTSSCTLAPGVQCSDMNTECCQNCRMAKKYHECYNSGNIECKKRSVCSGNSYSCPLPKNAQDWTPCFDGGLCYRGRCLGFCEVKSIKENVSLKSCMCQGDNACKWCCFDYSSPNQPGPCKPYSDQILLDGRPCYYGYCEGGECKRNITSTIMRIYSYLQTIPSSSYSFGEFLKSNIVLMVILVVSLFWIPISWVVYNLDSESREKVERRFFCIFRYNLAAVNKAHIKRIQQVANVIQVKEDKQFLIESQDTTRHSEDSEATSVKTDTTVEGTTFSEKLRRPTKRHKKIKVPPQENEPKESLVACIQGPFIRNASISVRKASDQESVEGNVSGSSGGDPSLSTELQTLDKPRQDSTNIK